MDWRKVLAILFAPVADFFAGRSGTSTDPDLGDYELGISLGLGDLSASELQREYNYLCSTRMDAIALAPRPPFVYRPEI